MYSCFLFSPHVFFFYMWMRFCLACAVIAGPFPFPPPTSRTTDRPSRRSGLGPPPLNRVWLEVHLPLSVVVLQGWRGQPVFQLVATDSRIHRVQRHTALRPDVAWTDPQLHRVRSEIRAPGPPSTPSMFQPLAPTAPKTPMWSLSSMGTGSSSLRPPPPLPP